MNKKAIAPIVAWVLLIGFSIALGTMVFTWTKSQTKELSEQTVKFGEGKLECTEISINIKSNEDCTKMTITNTGKLNIANLSIRTFDKEDNLIEVRGIFDILAPKASVELDRSSISPTSVNRIEILPIVDIDGKLIGCNEKKVIETSEQCGVCKAGETKLCDKQYGVCLGIQTSCQNDQWLPCNYGANYEAEETKCDTLDNDCDNSIDERCDDDSDYYCDDTFTCASPYSPCSSGVCEDCEDDPEFNGANIYPGKIETCNDGIDNNCNSIRDCSEAICEETQYCRPVLIDSFTAENSEAMGVLATDGTYLYGKSWYRQDNNDRIITKIGSGFSGTTAGRFYSNINTVPVRESLSMTYINGHIYDGYSENGNTLERINIATGVIDTITLGDFLINRIFGTPHRQPPYQWIGPFELLITSDGTYLYNLAFGINGNVFSGFIIRIFDPNDNWKMIKEIKINTPSYYIIGAWADGKYIYAIEWCGCSSARITKLKLDIVAGTGTIVDQWTFDQTWQLQKDGVTGQYDSINDVYWLGELVIQGPGPAKIYKFKIPNK